jgi:transposase
MEREFVYAYTAIEPATGENYSFILPEVNNATMSLYLEEFSKHYSDYRIVLVLDSASFHGVSTVSNINNIQIMHLPAYSPELNPVESFWNYLRKNYFGNKYWTSMDELEIYLKSILNDVHNNEKDTIKSLACFSWIKYMN